MDSMESAIDVKLKALHGDVSEIKSSLSALTQAITKLALIEERQSTSNAAMDRAFTAINDLSTRMQAMELSLPELKVRSSQASVWIDRFVWVIVSGALVYMMKTAGFIS